MNTVKLHLVVLVIAFGNLLSPAAAQRQITLDPKVVGSAGIQFPGIAGGWVRVLASNSLGDWRLFRCRFINYEAPYCWGHNPPRNPVLKPMIPSVWKINKCFYTDPAPGFYCDAVTGQVLPLPGFAQTLQVNPFLVDQAVDPMTCINTLKHFLTLPFRQTKPFQMPRP